MAKDAVATMGAVLPDDAGGRDAVHVAVFSAVSEGPIRPGTSVGIVKHGERDSVVSVSCSELIGIVDPYITKVIKPGQRFWVYLYPRTITALSHKWSHPAFEAADSSYVPPSQKLISEKWLRDFCGRNNIPDYETFMQAVQDQLGNGEDYIFISGQDASGDIPAEMWEHVSNVLGSHKVDADKLPKYFSCSC